MISRAWGIAVAGGAVLVIAAWYFYFPGSSSRPDFGTTTGEIIVSSPEVYSRERLVNDRFQEATWLQGQLDKDKMDKLPWGAQAYVQSSKDDRLESRTGVGGASAASASPGGAGTAPTPSPQSSDGPPSSSPIDLFRDKVAYREEVRAASLETQLDDRHDILGNTLYRVKFSVTVVPENDTSAWAVVYVQIKEGKEQAYRELYREWVSYYQDQLNAELDRLTDGREWQPDELWGFSSYLARVFKKIKCPNAKIKCPSADDGCCADDDCCRDLAETMAKSRPLVEELGRNQFAEQQKKCEKFATSNPNLKVVCNTAAATDANCDAPWRRSGSGASPCPWPFDEQSRLEPPLRAYRDALYAGRPTDTMPGVRRFLREAVAGYLLDRLERTEVKLGHEHPLWSPSVTDCDVGLCRMKLEARKDDAVAKEFAAALATDQVFAYAVSPKESAQRIATFASSQRERQFALQAKLPAGQIPLDSLLQRSQKEDSLLQAMLRKPLVVGFADPTGTNKTSAKDVAAFGWIIGPRFDIEGDVPRFRHVTTGTDVSAIISVPGWWKWAEAKVTTCWMDEREVRTKSRVRDGFDLYADCKGKDSIELPPIGLPGNVNEVARKLRLDVVRRPSVSNPVGVSVAEGARADILITGNHLWRSTVVTLGGQPADNIVVLPDMKGIVARFDPVLPRAEGPVTHELWVFTSEGKAQAGFVTIKKPDRTSTPTTH